MAQEEEKIVEINTWLPWEGPHKNQKIITDSKKRFKHIRCGRRFGKTSREVKWMFKQAIENPKWLGFYIAPTYRQAKMIAWKMLVDTANAIPDEYYKGIIYKINESELYCELRNGSRIDIKGADNPDSLRGVGLNHATLDEYAFMKRDVWYDIIQPALLDKQGSADIVGTPNGFDHFYELDLFAKEHPEEWDTFHFTSYDNPTLSKEEIDRRKAEIPEDQFAQEYLAEYRKRTGLVYPEFDREKHIEILSPVAKYTICGVDFGYTNPAAILKIIEHDDGWYVDDEFYKSGKSDEELAEYTKAFEPNFTYADPESPEKIKVLNDKVYVSEVIKGKGSVERGISIVRQLFLTGQLKIHPRCKNLIWELETYAYPEDTGIRNPQEKPQKKNDHAVDALRYPLMMRSSLDKSGGDEKNPFSLYDYTYD